MTRSNREANRTMRAGVVSLARTRTLLPLWVAAGAWLLAACGGSRVLVPPRVDLSPYYRVGLVTFTIENAKGSLNVLATERFLGEVLGGQQGIEVLELGEAERVLNDVGETRLDARAARAIGQEHGVPAVFFGHLKVSDVKPRAVLAGFPHVEARVSVELSVRLISSESGGTLWTSSGKASDVVGEVGITGGDVFFSAEHPEEAYGRLVDALVFEVTHDLRPRWVKR
ncbi:MAG: hypothetical protein OEO20_09765 [Gemmatimonadota bacterium]|nr:hypothetical protein [Gemmatimonadota bacterium]MDH3478579.1 hypothetical protein [Gemmatimonadota bacterium]MDH3568984.1 hypothetical protein [Gemmatimonadota bacterium]MDH5548375.1 hypothetical protein [Gemmatimonadota bacterium]